MAGDDNRDPAKGSGLSGALAATLAPDFLWVNRSRVLNPIEAACEGSQLAEKGHSLQEALGSVLTTAMLPLTMATHQAYERIYQIRVLARQIEAGAHINALSDDDNEAIGAKAHEEVRSQLDSPAGFNTYMDSIADILRASLGSDDVQDATHQLLRQATVTIWSAFEVFCSDSIVQLVNDHPTYALQLMNSEKTKKYLGGKATLAVEVLAEHDFNLTGKVGEAFFSGVRLDSLSMLRELLLAIVPEDSEFRKIILSDVLWVLNQAVPVGPR